ncbi:MAG: hypothetical protein WCK84_04275 [Bacteroidota bacterium]
MNKELVKSELQWLIEAINEQYDAIQRHSDKIPLIEFDILMENLRKFYENMFLLQRLNDPHFSYEKLNRPKEIPKVPQGAPSPFQFVKDPKLPEPPSIPKKPGKLQEIDLFAAEEPAFNIKLKDAREKTFSPRIPSERIQNLKTAISINEKFMFINELFDGNLREYNETIETLNGFTNLDQAADFLDLMRKKNFWDTGSNPFKKLKELLERRF